MKYIFVGDVHGKVDAVKEALSRDGMKIFVGDFIDSYDRTAREHRECYDLVLEAIKKKEARAIYGNHDLSYLMPKPHRCSGFSIKHQQVVQEVASDLLQYLEPFIFLDESVLITHAGLTRQLWDQGNLKMENLSTTLTAWWFDRDSPAHWIGEFRGGSKRWGGIFWCDFNAEFIPVPELTQVFGHTRGKGIRKMINSFCIDCLDGEYEFLEMEI